MAGEKRPGDRAYWILVGVLCAVGVLGIFTIGFPLLIVGVTLAALAPVRARPLMYWPVLLAVVGFFVGYALVAPWTCSQEARTVVGGASFDTGVVCHSLGGVSYTGPGNYNPPLLPGALAGLGTAVVAGAVTWLVVRRRALTSSARTLTS